MTKKFIFTIFPLLLFLFLIPTGVEAKRLLPRVAAARRSAGSSPPRRASYSTRGAAVRVKFRPDRRAITATFTNLSVASTVKYELTYQSNGKQEGIVGSVNPATDEGAVRTLLFGTCSGGVCRYHTNITNARFTVTTTLKSGLKVIKPFKLKV